jgi:hypothetical protein
MHLIQVVFGSSDGCWKFPPWSCDPRLFRVSLAGEDAFCKKLRPVRPRLDDPPTTAMEDHIRIVEPLESNRTLLNTNAARLLHSIAIRG